MLFQKYSYLLCMSLCAVKLSSAQAQTLDFDIDVYGQQDKVISDQNASPTVPPVPEVDEFLRNLDGVSVGRKGGKGIEPVIRGQQQSQLNIVSGNASILGACPGRMDPPTSYISMVGYDRIKVIKGFDSVIYGSGGSGGSLIFERDRPDFSQKSFIGLVKGQYSGNSHRKGVQADLTSGDESAYIRVYGEYQNSDHYKDGEGNRVSSAYQSVSGGLVLAADLTEFTEVEFSLDVTRDRDVFYAGSGMDSPEANADLWQLKVNHNQQVGFIDEQEINVYFSAVNHLMDNYSLRLRNPNNTEGVKTPSTAKGYGGRWLATVYWGEDNWDEWRFGADYREQRQNAERFKVNRATSDSSLQAWVWPGIQQRHWGLFTEVDSQITPGNQLRIGFRLDGHLSEATKANNGAGSDSNPNNLYQKYYSTKAENSTQYAFSNFASLQHWFNDEQSIKTRISRSIRFADATEQYFASRGSCCHGSDDWVGNPDIKPEEHYQLDLGYHLQKSQWHLVTTAYIDEISNYILRYKSESGALLYRNTDARIYGIEVEANYRIGHFKPALSLNWTRGINRKPMSVQDENLPQIPALLTVARLDYEEGKWLLGSSCEFAASQDNVNINSGQDAGLSPGFGVCHFRGQYQVTAGLKMLGGVHNVFNKTYAWHVSKRNSDPFSPDSMRVNEPGREFWIGTEITF